MLRETFPPLREPDSNCLLQKCQTDSGRGGTSAGLRPQYGAARASQEAGLDQEGHRLRLDDRDAVEALDREALHPKRTRVPTAAYKPSGWTRSPGTRRKCSSSRPPTRTPKSR